MTLSNRPDKVSGGDVLVKVVVPDSTSLDAVTVTLNAVDVTGALWQDPANRALVGLVSGMAAGKNRLEAKAKGAGTDKLDILNHALTGPIFSGPQEKPFYGAGTSSCNDLYPAAAFPRYVAGMPLSNDIAACRLRTVDVADYTVSFTPAEVARLHTIFPKGVCDYARTGFDQPDLLSTWLEYMGVGTYKKDRGPQD